MFDEKKPEEQWYDVSFGQLTRRETEPDLKEYTMGAGERPRLLNWYHKSTRKWHYSCYLSLESISQTAKETARKGREIRANAQSEYKYWTLVQEAVEKSINKSITENRSIILKSNDVIDSEYKYWALVQEAEDYQKIQQIRGVDIIGVVEFWGTTDDGNEWRVDLETTGTNSPMEPDTHYLTRYQLAKAIGKTC